MKRLKNLVYALLFGMVIGIGIDIAHSVEVIPIKHDELSKEINDLKSTIKEQERLIRAQHDTIENMQRQIIKYKRLSEKKSST